MNFYEKFIYNVVPNIGLILKPAIIISIMSIIVISSLNITKVKSRKEEIHAT